MPGSHLSVRTRRALAAASLLLSAATTAGCASFPADTEGTLDRVRDGQLRVGITHNPPWTDTTGAPSGSEAQLVEQFAADLNADVVWTEASEAVLAEALRRGELDLAVGGFTDDAPWMDKAALTIPYTEARDEHDQLNKHVMLTSPGENRFLLTLEEFLREEGEQ